MTKRDERDGIEVHIVSPAGHAPADACSLCKKPFAGDEEDGGDERIRTLHVTRGSVTLCRPCYRAAGNDVR